MLLALLLSLVQDAPVTITVVERDSGKPIFARVVLKNSAGKIIDSTGYKTLNGHFVPPDGWKLSLPKGKYSIHADAGYEHFAADEDWTFDGAPTKSIELKRWVYFRTQGWVAGGDHNHLIRDGAGDKNYGKSSVTMEFAAALHASRGWTYYYAGGGGPWILDANPKQELHNGKRTEAAAAAWNQKYGEHLRLWWNNEALKTRYGHVWIMGQSKTGPTYPYTEKSGDAWWSFYDDSWDPWQTGNRAQPIGPYKSSLWPLPPVFDCIQSWRERGLIAIYAHPTRTFRIGKNLVSNIAVEFPFDLLAGAPVGGLVINGDMPNSGDDYMLWFAALNEGYHVPGFSENDTVFGGDSIRANPHVTYTYAPGPFDFAKTAAAAAEGRNFASSGAFCTLQADGKYGMGDTAPDAPKHEFEVRAWASADPADTIELVEITVDGWPAWHFDDAKGKREFTGKASIPASKWAIVKVLCKNANVMAVTNPIYFGSKKPEPVFSTVKGRVTVKGEAQPADIVVTLWGKEFSRAKTKADGTYRLDGVPLAAHLTFSNGTSSIDRTILFHDPRISALQEQIWSTQFTGKGGVGDVFPTDYFKMLRDLAKETTLDAELP